MDVLLLKRSHVSPNLVLHMHLIHYAIQLEVGFSLLDYLLQNSLPRFIVYLVLVLPYEPLSEHVAEHSACAIWNLLPHHSANYLLLVFSSVKPATVLLELSVQAWKVFKYALHQ